MIRGIRIYSMLAYIYIVNPLSLWKLGFLYLVVLHRAINHRDYTPNIHIALR